VEDHRWRSTAGDVQIMAFHKMYIMKCNSTWFYKVVGFNLSISFN
jgi:hypothetical protein